MAGDPDMARAEFTSMVNSTPEDWQRIAAEFARFTQGLPDRILAHLRLLEGSYGGFRVDRLTHSLQTATLAQRAGRDEEYVVCALLHDIGDTLASFNHPDVAAAMLKPFVSEANLWMVEKHGIFQGYYYFHHVGLDRNARDQYRGHPYFERTAEFCAEYDAPAFDPDGETLPLSFFEPMVRRVCAKGVYSGSGAPDASEGHPRRLSVRGVVSLVARWARTRQRQPGNDRDQSQHDQR